ncbi:MAG: CapA family protein [Myxococcota bacterium]
MNNNRRVILFSLIIVLIACVVAVAALLLSPKDGRKAEEAHSQHDLPDFYSDNPAPVLTLVGDIYLGASGLSVIEKKGYRYPFDKVRRLLKGDIIIGNQEAPITEREEMLDEKKLWNAKQSPLSLDALKNEGFTLLSLANNHISDYRLAGVLDTIGHLESAGIEWCGFDKDPNNPDEGRVIEARGVKFGFLCYQSRLGLSEKFWGKWNWFSEAGSHPGVPLLTAERIERDIRRLREEKGAQVVVVINHWGEDYKPVTEEQKTIGRKAIDLGADLVVGHHSHIPQTVEIYADKPIIYGLGNFAFLSGGRFKKKSLERLAFGLVTHIKIGAGGWEWIRLTPVWVNNRHKKIRYRARPATQEQSAELFDEILSKGNPALEWKLDGAAAVIVK